jgi:hypothetical protein
VRSPEIDEKSGALAATRAIINTENDILKKCNRTWGGMPMMPALPGMGMAMNDESHDGRRL